MRRFGFVAQALAAAAVALGVTPVGAEPLRAGDALPSISRANASYAPRAATPTAHDAALGGPFSLLGLVVALTVTTAVVVVAVSKGGRSPG